MIKLKKSEKNLLYITIAVAACALIILVGSGRVLRGPSGLKQEVIARKNELRRLNYLKENSETIKKEWSKIKEENDAGGERSTSSPPPKAEGERSTSSPAERRGGRIKSAPILDGIYKIARNSGVSKITGITPMDARNAENYAELPVQINFQAGMDSLVRFLFNIDSSPLPLAVEYLNVYPDSEEAGLIYCQATVTALKIGAKRPAGLPAHILASSQHRWQAGALKIRDYAALFGKRLFKPAYTLASSEAPAGNENLEMTARELEDSLVVSGFVFDGVVTKALIENRRRGAGAEFYKENDTIEGAKILKISEKDGEVMLLYPGGRKINLKMSNKKEPSEDSQ